VRLLRGYMLLLRKVERLQWVNRYYRIKVLSNAAGLFALCCAVLKLNVWRWVLYAIESLTFRKRLFYSFGKRIYLKVEVNLLISSNESVVTAVDSSPIPGNKQMNIINKIKCVAVSTYVVRLL